MKELRLETHGEITSRVRQIGSMFDVPVEQRRQTVIRYAQLPLSSADWRIGAIIGPSGSGKSTIIKSEFGVEQTFRWDASALIDDFECGLERACDSLSSVGLSTIPAWVRPFSTLSNGEQFRAELARKLASNDPLIVMDEFTSVVDRQVAKVASHAFQKAVRRSPTDQRCVVASCHYDIVDWLQPDWVLNAATGELIWRSVQPRPQIEVEIRQAAYADWAKFKQFHYLDDSLSKAARCYELCVDENPVCFAALLHFPHPKRNGLKAVSRVVTLPDFQGLGLAFVLLEHLGAAHKSWSQSLLMRPRHPPLVRSFQRSSKWAQIRGPRDKPDKAGKATRSGLVKQPISNSFEYVGPELEPKFDRRIVKWA